MLTLIKRLYATIHRAYIYGGLVEVFGCIKAGCTVLVLGLLGGLAKASSPPEFWPSWSPELLAYRPYREGRWAIRSAANTPLTYASLFSCLTQNVHASVPVRQGSPIQGLAAKRISSDFQLPAGDADIHALQDCLRAMYQEQRLLVTRTANNDIWRIDFSEVPQKVTSIIIPTRDRVDLLDNCIRSIQRYSKPGTYEIIVVDNGSIEPYSMAYFSNLEKSMVARIVRDAGLFNWSRLNNLGATLATGETYLFLNNDIEVLSCDWLIRLSGFCSVSGIGCVGPMLVYEDRTIQHAGVVVGMGRWADHVYKFADPDLSQSNTLFVPPAIVRPVLALTGACLAVSRTNFTTVGGFDEGFATIFSDTDFCIRLHEAGLRNIYLGDVRLVHFESKTRDPSALPVADFRRAFTQLEPYRTQLADPYFHPDFSRFSLIPRLKSQRIDLARWTRL